MLAQLLKVTMVATVGATVVVWMRRRWKWLGACVAAILAAVYLHAEFLDYVAALPASSNQAVVASDYIPLAFVLKLTIIVCSLLAYFLFEIRISRRRNTNRRSSRSTEVLSSRTAVESISDGASAPDARKTDDGFDFLRRKQKLQGRAEKIINRKPARSVGKR